MELLQNRFLRKDRTINKKQLKLQRNTISNPERESDIFSKEQKVQ
jgi:hypothetical protein